VGAALSAVPVLEVELFQPDRDNARGVWMHQPGGPDRVMEMSPGQPPGQDNPGWAYGAFAVERYTTFDPSTRVLDLHYIISTASPYQVHLMHTVLVLPDPVVG
jgi:hypothetical protein